MPGWAVSGPSVLRLRAGPRRVAGAGVQCCALSLHSAVTFCGGWKNLRVPSGSEQVRKLLGRVGYTTLRGLARFRVRKLYVQADGASVFIPTLVSAA